MDGKASVDSESCEGSDSYESETSKDLTVTDYVEQPLRGLGPLARPVPYCHLVLGALFYLQLVLHLAAVCFVLSERRAIFEPVVGACPAGYRELDGSCVDWGRLSSSDAPIRVGWDINITVMSAKGLRPADVMGQSADPYVECNEVYSSYDDVYGNRQVSKRLFKTPSVTATLAPVWNFSTIAGTHGNDYRLVCKVMDADVFSDDLMGSFWLAASSFLPNGFDQDVLLKNDSQPVGVVQFRVRALGRTHDAHWRNSVNRVHMWHLLRKYLYVPLVCALFLFLVPAVWLLALVVCTRATAVCSIGAAVLLLAGLSFLMQSWVMLLPAAAIAVLVLCAWDGIETAIGITRVAVRALRKTPCVFIISAVLQLASVGYGLVFWYATMKANMLCMLEEDYGFAPDHPLPAHFLMRWAPVLFLVTMQFLRHCVLAVCTLSVGAWYFPEAAQSLGSLPSPAMHGAQLAFTSCSGSVVLSSLVTPLMEEMNRQCERGHCWDDCLWLVDPLGLVLRLLGYIAERLVGTLTRFALIAQLLHGDGFCNAAHNSAGAIRNRFANAVLTGFVAEKLLGYISMAVATGLLFSLWWFIELKDTDEAHDGALLRMLLLVVVSGVVRRPMLSLALIYLFCEGWWFRLSNDLMNSFLIAALCACVASIILMMVGTVIEFSTDTILYCMALEAEGSQCQHRLRELYSMAKAPSLAPNAAAPTEEALGR